jgi:hypothetical protein
MFSAVEAEQHGVMPNCAVGLEAELHGGEIDWPVMLMDLYRVSPAERDMGSAFAAQVGEIPLAANCTIGARDGI